jgi:hypothetical protein
MDSYVLPPTKRQKTTTSALSTKRRVSPPPLRQVVPVTPTKKLGVFGSRVPTNRAKKPPVRPLGAAEGFEDVDDAVVVGRVTPKRRERSLTPLLASSHKIMPRPQPPLRKSSPLKKSRAPLSGTIEVDEDENLIPRGSPKTYFSSPASSTSSSFAPKKNKGPPSPSSPSLLVLGHSNPDFTVNPGTFDPLFTSTQNGPEGDGSGGGGGGQALRRKGTGSSTGFKFNSQFDVDRNVEDTVALLERDVDVDNWFVDLGGDADLNDDVYD